MNMKTDYLQEAENLLSKFAITAASNLFPDHTYKKKIYDAVNYLLIHNFDKLVNILYRVDVSENKLKTALKNNRETDAALVITDLLIQRQAEKLNTRKN